MTGQAVIVALLIIVAAIYMIRRGIRHFGAKTGCGCDKCPAIKFKDKN